MTNHYTGTLRGNSGGARVQVVGGNCKGGFTSRRNSSEALLAAHCGGEGHMGSIVSTLFGNRKPGVEGWVPGKGKAEVVLRGRSKRAYSFEMHTCDAAAALDDVPAVYIYARTVPAGSSMATAGHANGAGLNVGYVGRTDNMGRQAAEHERLQHFTGHGLDMVLILRIQHDTIRRDIERDLIEAFNPVLNDLLRGYNPAELSS
jgi:hypothetical protein